MYMVSLKSYANDYPMRTDESSGFQWIPFTQHGYWGAKNSKGKVLIAPKFFYINFENGYFSVKDISGNIGQYTSSGKVVFPPIRYTVVFQVSGMKNSPFIVVGDGYGALDNNGNVLLEEGFTAINVIGDADSGYNFSIFKDGFQGIADMKGNIIIPLGKYHAIGRQKVGGKVYFFGIVYGGGSSVFDAKGKEILHTDHYTTIPKSDGKNLVFEVTDGNATGEIDINGNFITPMSKPKNTKLQTFPVGDLTFTLWRDTKNKYYLRDASGKVIIEPKYDWIAGVANKSIIVRDKQYMGIFDTKGNEVIPASEKYLSFGAMDDYIIAMSIDNKQALYGYNGKIFFPAKHKYVIPKFIEHDACTDTLICFSENSRLYGVKTLDDRLLVQPEWNSIQIFNTKFGLYFGVVREGKMGLLDCNGKLIIDPQFSKITPSDFGDIPFFFVSNGYVGACDTEGNMFINPETFEILTFDHSKKLFTGKAGKRECIFDLSGKLLSDNQQDVKRDEFIDLADAAFETGKYKDAAKFYSSALNLSPSPSLYFNRGVSYYNDSKYSDAIADFNMALDNNPSERVRDRAIDLIEKAEYYQGLKEERNAQIGMAIFGLAMTGLQIAVNNKVVKSSRNATPSGYSSSGTNVSENYSESFEEGGKETQNNTKKKCGFCGGRGSTVEYTANYGIDNQPWCEECGKHVVSGHYHKKCTHCNGTGEY